MTYSRLFKDGFGLQSNQKKRRLANVWEPVILVITTGIAVAIPVRLVLGEGALPGFSYLEAVVTLVFAADIVLNLRTAKKGGELYGRGLLAADILAALPLSFLPGLTPLLCLRLCKLARVAHAMAHWRQQHLHRWNALRLLYFIYWLALSVHWLASGWLALRGIPSGADRWTLYLHSLYWCISTLTTIGYGDITPSNNAEIIYAMGVMIFGVGMYGYVIANISTIIANLQPARTRYLENMEKLGAFMRTRAIPAGLQQRIRDYYGYVWKERLGYDETTIVQGLPPGLNVEVSLFLKRDIIQKVPFFADATEDLVRDIAMAMHPVVYTPGDYVCRAGEPGMEMFFISRGSLEVIGRDHRTVVATLSDGEFFGEIALVQHQPRTASVRAVSYCDVYRLGKTSFDRIMEQYPEFNRHIRKMSAERQEPPR